jgi:hypothetical protein
LPSAQHHAASEQKQTERKEQKMNNRRNTNPVLRPSLALALALAIWIPAHAQSPTPAAKMTEATMMEHCQEMKEQKQKLKDDGDAQNAQITAQLSEMNSAPKDKKMNLMAAVVTHAVEQRIAMDARKAKMEDEMMMHMMEHMQMGKDSMAQCPMMKDMKDMDENSAGAHKEHQKEQK